MHQPPASAALPSALLGKVQQHFSGGYLWVGRKGEAEQRNARVRQKHDEGASADALAREFGLSRRSIQRILQSDTEC